MAEARRVSKEEWAQAMANYAGGYLGVSFAELNSHKCKALHYILCGASGIIAGESDGMLRSPFSAPYGGFVNYEKGAARQLADYCRAAGLDCEITLPAEAYGEEPRLQARELSDCGFAVSAVDANYHYEFPGGDFGQLLGATGKKKLRCGLRSTTVIKQGGSELLSEAYAIIERNRIEHGYPLKMSFEQMLRTAEIIPTECFIARTETAGPEASAIVHRAMSGTAQVVYWGNAAGTDAAYGRNFPIMHALIWAVYSHYSQQSGMRLLDTGPASDHGVLLPGLAQFKERIGCRRSDKLTFKLLNV